MNNSMYLHITVWSARPAWLALDQARRADYLANAGAGFRRIGGNDVKLIGYFPCHDISAGRYRYVAVWSLRERKFLGHLETSLAEIKLEPLFERESWNGETMDLADLLSDMQRLGDPIDAMQSVETPLKRGWSAWLPRLARFLRLGTVEETPAHHDEYVPAPRTVAPEEVEEQPEACAEKIALPDTAPDIAFMIREGDWFDVATYLKRIEYSGPLDRSARTLAALHHAHLLAIPFENIDMIQGVPVLLDERRIFEKIVLARRGGIGYELNVLFAALLRRLGFDVTFIAAAIPEWEGKGAEFSHMALMVRTGGRWLADVGAGISFREPIALDREGEQKIGDDIYRIDNNGGYRILRCRCEDMIWEKRYSFTLIPRSLEDFAPMCDLYQTSRDSHFNRGMICSRMTRDGWVALTEKCLIHSRNGNRSQRDIDNGYEFARALRDEFSIELTELSVAGRRMLPLEGG